MDWKAVRDARVMWCLGSFNYSIFYGYSYYVCLSCCSYLWHSVLQTLGSPGSQFLHVYSVKDLFVAGGIQRSKIFAACMQNSRTASPTVGFS